MYTLPPLFVHGTVPCIKKFYDTPDSTPIHTLKLMRVRAISRWPRPGVCNWGVGPPWVHQHGDHQRADQPEPHLDPAHICVRGITKGPINPSPEASCACGKNEGILPLTAVHMIIWQTPRNNHLPAVAVC